MSDLMKDKKKLVSLALIIVAVIIAVLDKGPMSVLFCSVILNGVYLVIQKKIDSAKTGGAAGGYKGMFLSKKWIAVMAGNAVAILGTAGAAVVNKLTGMAIPVEWIAPLLVMVSGYLGLQGTGDITDPNNH